MKFDDNLYDVVTEMIDRSKAPDDLKPRLHSLLDFAYRKCNPIRLANVGCGE